MLYLSAQKRVKQLRLCLFDGNKVLQKEKEKHHKQVGIPCRLVHDEINREADKSTTDEQAMVNECIFHPQFHHEAVLARGFVILIVAHVVDVENGVGEKAHGRGRQQNAEIKRLCGQIEGAGHGRPTKEKKAEQIA